MKIYSIWFNRNGIDECYGEVKGEKFNKKVLDEIKNKVDFIEGCYLNDFEIEEKGDNWVMYAYDGIGIFEVNEGCDVNKCKEEYNELVDCNF